MSFLVMYLSYHAGPRARTVLLSRFQSCFSLDEYQSEQIDKGQRGETSSGGIKVEALHGSKFSVLPAVAETL